MLLSEDITPNTIKKNYFSNLGYEFISTQNLPSCKSLSNLIVQTVSNKNSNDSLQIKFSSSESICIKFTDKFFYTPKTLDSFQEVIPFYLNLTQLHKNINKETSSEKYSYVAFYLDLYNSEDKKIGQTVVTPNTNILFDKEYFSNIGIVLSDISYFKLSMVLKEPCKFNLHFFTFDFYDFMSTDTFYSKSFDVIVRLQVNNLRKKKNGVIIFFPSFYIKERDTDSINNLDNSVKWPNFTRYTWSKDLENYCTIFVADPFQYANNNDKSSWFVAPNGKSILPEIAQYIRNLLECDEELENVSNIPQSQSFISNEKNLESIQNTETKDFKHKLLSINSIFRNNSKPKCGPIINYGSSMGGFAAFLFSCYLEPTLCFCECPQTNLIKYKYSKEYLETCEGLGLKDISSSLSSCPINEKNKKREQLISDIVKKHDLSFSAILRNHEPKFRSLIHFYSIDKLHLTSFDNEICSLTDEERKTFNYQLVIENDIENQLFAHQAMPKEKVLEIFRHYLSMAK